MKKISFFVLFSIVLFACTEALAGSVSVEPFVEGGAAEDQTEEIFAHHFGGAEIEIPLMVSGEASGLVDVQAELLQISSALYAPIGEPILILSNQKIDEPKKTSVLITLPEVQRETAFGIQFLTKQNSEEDWREAGMVKIQAYPKELLAPFKTWSESIDLYVEDPGGVLVDFLTEQEVEFFDSKSKRLDEAKLPKATLIVKRADDETSKKFSTAHNQIIVIFHEKTKTVPKIVAKPFRGGTIVEVELPLIKDLAEKPQAQKAFLEIIQLANQ